MLRIGTRSSKGCCSGTDRDAMTFDRNIGGAVGELFVRQVRALNLQGGAVEVEVAAQHLAFGVLPGTTHPKHLRAVDPADTQERAGSRHALAPAHGHLRPLARPAEVSQLLARPHEMAVDVARPSGIEFVGDGSHHRLVEQRHAVAHPPPHDEHTTLAEHARGDQCLITEPLPHVFDPLRRAVGIVQFPCVERGLEADDVVEVAVLDDGSIVVFAVSAVTPGDPEEASDQEREMLRQQLAMLAGNEAAATLLQTLRQQMKVTVIEAQL
jgi:hypothetical protein